MQKKQKIHAKISIARYFSPKSHPVFNPIGGKIPPKQTGEITLKKIEIKMKKTNEKTMPLLPVKTKPETQKDNKKVTKKI